MQKSTIASRAACDWCGSNKLDRIQNRDAFSGEVFEVIWCAACEMGATDFKSEKPLSSYYPVAYYGTHDRRFVGIMESLVRLSRRQRAVYVEKRASGRGKRILDYGCGRGLMLAFLKNRHWSCVGTEYSEASSQYARNLGLDVAISSGNKDPIELVQGPFSVITAWHVLEHVSRPAWLAQQFHALLEPSGRLFLEVPNFSSFQAALSRAHWIYTECPRHLFHFSPKGLVQLMERSGFEVRAMSTFSWEYGVFGCLQSLLNTVCPYKNLLFYLLRNPSGKPHRFPLTPSALLSAVITAVLAVPLLPVSALLEAGLSLLNKGGVVTMVAQKRSS